MSSTNQFLQVIETTYNPALERETKIEWRIRTKEHVLETVIYEWIAQDNCSIQQPYCF